jgi:hypothetical protein
MFGIFCLAKVMGDASDPNSDFLFLHGTYG